MSNAESYLRAILGVVARATFPPEKLAGEIGIGASKSKQLEAYNLCDGTLTQGEIAKKVGLDAGNFSRTLGRWIDDGLIVRIESNGQLRPVHLYPIPTSLLKKAEKGG